MCRGAGGLGQGGSSLFVRTNGGYSVLRLPEQQPRRTPTGEWAIVDSNHGPPPYQSGALTD